MDFLLLTLITPFIGALLSYTFKNKAAVIASLFSLLTLLFSLLSIFETSLSKVKIYYSFSLFKWLNANFGLICDPLTSILLILITVIGFFVILYSCGYMSPQNADHPFYKPYGSYYFLMLLFIGAMVGVATAANFLQLFFFWEITTLCSWALISYTKEKKALFSGLKAFIMTHIGGLGFLIALGLMYYQAKSFDFSVIDFVSYKFVIFALLFFAASAKSAQIPLFTWLPDAMVAPTPVSAYLHAAAMVKAGVYLMARIYLSNYSLTENEALVTGIIAVSTMMLSVILYYFQDDLKKLLAYSTIGHLGYILFGVSLGIYGSKTGGMGGVFHIINHGFAKGLLFLSVGAIAYATGSKSIRELQGVSKKFPLITACFLTGMFAIIGVPPFSGFWSKFMIFTGAFEIKNTTANIFGIIAIFESILAFCWYIFVGHRVFFGQASHKVSNANCTIPLSMKFSLIILLILSLLSPLIGYYFIEALSGGQ
ncbi:hydrogenase-4 component D [Thermodesulfovibrio aggregans]|uniref:Hydrogenase-4 component D n=1 Tax=Thermodesulfovibrio aggregans TaxID=86166 RepID=A0A0U9HP20_9BACT|nr:hydrogenase 4 subunit D [Thermodesulfovibrio aggregans]GAQ94808.1 hydrogenase-4 component D [Thermodesulfovibrio aggregans]